VRKLLRRIHYWLNRRRAAAELTEEMESHRLMRQAKLEQSGLSAEEASFASKRAMGNAFLSAEQAREIWTWRWLDDAWRDLAHGLRAFLKSPGFPLGASLILSLGIGINVAVFQLMDVMYWRPPEIRDPASVVRLFKSQRGGDFSYPAARMFVPNNSAFSSFFFRVGFPSDRIIWGEDSTKSVWGSYFVSSNWFEELGIQPKYGRVFNPTDDAGGAPPTIVISEVLWDKLLNSDPEIVGKSVRVNDRSAVVIGVVPPDVMPRRALIWMPITQFDYFVPGSDFKTSWDKSVEVYGRLKAGVPPAAVRGALQPLMDEFSRLHPEIFKERDFFIPSSASARFEDPRGGPSLFFLGMPPVMHLFLALLILLIACANLMNLVLSRAMNRVRDLSIRVSLGAGRWRIMRQLLAENALLVLFSSIAGLVFAYWGTQMLLASASLDWTGLQINITWRTIIATLVVGSIAAGAIGLLPAWKISRSNLTIAIKDGGQQASAGLQRTRWRHVLLAAQIGCSCLLLVLTGVILRSLQQTTTNVGFNPDNVAVLTVPRARQELKAEEAFSYWSRLRESLESDPGAESVSLVWGLWGTEFQSEKTGPVSYYEAGPGFFSVMKIPILVGRDFNAADSFGSAAIISQRLAIKMYGSTNVIGLAFPTADLSVPGGVLDAAAKVSSSATVIGVAADAGFVRSDSEDGGTLYFPPDPATSNRALLVRARSSAANLVPVLRTAALNLKSSLLPDPRSLAEYFDERRGAARALSTVLAVLGGLALSITCIGIFGSVSYAATLRRQEIGIRMALGGARIAMLLLLLKQLRWPVGIGLVFGLAAAIPVGYGFVATPFPVTPFDPPILTIVGGFVILTAVIAALLPASRAVRQDPMDSLRSE
jgi:predicted permease